MGVHNPGEHQHVDLAPPWRATAPARRHRPSRPRSGHRRSGSRGGPGLSDCRSAATLNAPCTLLARCGRDRPICCWVGRTAPQRVARHLHAALPRDRPAPARRTGCSGGSSLAASAAAPAPARRPRRAVRARPAPSSGPSQAPDRCGPGISAHAPACARRRHSAPRRGRAHRPADRRSPPSTTGRGRDRRRRECRAGGKSGGAMNDSFAQHAAQTPSPSTGSRQATHSVGSAMSSASRAACAPCAATRL